MGFAATKSVRNTTIEQEAYGRIEKITYQKDSHAKIEIEWYRNKDEATQRKPSLNLDSFVVRRTEILEDEQLQNALNTVIASLYVKAKTKDVFADVEDVTE